MRGVDFEELPLETGDFTDAIQLLNRCVELDKRSSLRNTANVNKLSTVRVAQQEGLHVL
jgi:hypothetical protein